MQKNLVIVESPAKAKTIEKFLGKDYKVMSSYGHIRDLKKKDLGVDLAHNYKPLYEIPADKKKLVSELKSAAKDADVVWLASDEDREGEAISWHLYEALDLKDKNSKRIAFHEITKNAILHAIENPREIDKNLVDAQQARRVLDRIVGFEVSPVLWKKVKPALSAGRVQSVAVRLIVEREREIQNFNTEAAYRIQAVFIKEENGTKYELKAELNKRLKTKEEAMALLEQLKNESAFAINDIQTKPVKKSPAAPFTTSTLQQEAARKLGFSVSQTMSVAQKLYESGKITYMRTDSVNLSSLAINTSRAEIETVYGKEYSKTRQFSTKAKGAQEAHEAIRPTYMNESKVSGSSQEQKLYDLIWKRTIASQMSDAELERTTVTIDLPKDNDLKFVSTGEVLKFDGFLRVYLEDTDDEPADTDEASLLPPLHLNEKLDLQETTATERFTQRPPRYTEASLVRKLEELGIGRPSTYAPTISTIQNREYVEKSNIEGVERKYNVLQLKKSKITDSIKTEITGADKNKLKPTDIGIVVNDFLTQSFPSILDYNFTAKVEKQFDNIAEGQEEWTHLIDTFYKSFHPVVDEVMNSHTDHKIGERILGSDPKTGKQVSVKIGRFGPMVQIGTQDDEEKPTFASLQKNQSLTTITLEEALKLFDLPRSVGEYEGKDMQVAVGRFGPYIRHDGKFVSLPRGLDPYAVTEEEAVQLIEEKRKKDSEKTISIFGEGDEEIQVLNGRYGPYITYQKGNYKIPKGTDAATLTEEQCKEIIKNTESTSSKSKKTSKTEKKTTKASSEKKGKSTKKSAK
ncbi:type I DNA topoisomerase [Dysgonomonas capnocytophagoides]|uniref:DNA topoisomerase 1 n=1 Tax=Dysgonomonas capnocytophagoides TaxID=45254 RepID=A0A4Y8LCD2_9BACT|nr:type I DNA topoisomerase [Dysgonomonas capnocytophagoides]TFD99122.1 type I DNA topoisomerase [Dysgonomonas capnocytophagoides]